MNDFFANLYELFGALNGDFYNDMFQEKFYLPLGIIMIASAVGIPLIYYYVVNHPRCNHWRHWLFFALGAAALNFIIDWFLAKDKLIAFYNQSQSEMPYTWDRFFMLALMGFLWTLLFFAIFSIIEKWGSRNCKHTPF